MHSTQFLNEVSQIRFFSQHCQVYIVPILTLANHNKHFYMRQLILGNLHILSPLDNIYPWGLKILVKGTLQELSIKIEPHQSILSYEKPKSKSYKTITFQVRVRVLFSILICDYKEMEIRICVPLVALMQS